MKNKSAYKEWEKKIEREQEIWFSEQGLELQLNLVAQGYSEILWQKFLIMFGSGFTALGLINKLEKEINNK